MSRLYLFLLLLCGASALAQTSQITGKTIPYATVTLLKTRLGTQASEAGTFKLTNVPTGTYRLRVSAVGYTESV